MNPIRFCLITLSVLALASCGGSGSGSSTPPPPPAAASYHMALQGSAIARANTSDCWGYTAPNGDRYGLMGTQTGMLVADLRNAANPTVVADITGPENGDPYFHHDIKTYGHYAYLSSETTGTRQGILIVDLSPLPSAPTYVRSLTPQDGSPTCHNLSIETTRGLLFLQRDNGGSLKGIEVWDLNTDPANPIYVTTFASGTPVHDMVAQGNYCYVANGSRGTFSVWDVSNINAPVLKNTWTGYGGYAHNIWPNANGTIVGTSEETVNHRIRFWSVDNTGQATEISSYLWTTPVIAHNVQWEGTRAYISHYTAGMVVLDMSTPSSPAVIGSYDTSPAHSGGTFNGCWGVYCFPGSNDFIASDIENGFHYLHLTP